MFKLIFKQFEYQYNIEINFFQNFKKKINFKIDTYKLTWNIILFYIIIFVTYSHKFRLTHP